MELTTLNFEVPSFAVGALMGLEGANVRALQGRSGITRVWISPEQYDEPATMQITGDQEAVKQLQKHVGKLIARLSPVKIASTLTCLTAS